MLIGAIDIGGTNTKTAILNETGEILVKDVFPSPMGADWRERFDRCVESLNKCWQEYQLLFGSHFLLKKELQGIGINLPGIVNAEAGTLIYAPYERWLGVTVRDYFCDRSVKRYLKAQRPIGGCRFNRHVIL